MDLSEAICSFILWLSFCAKGQKSLFLVPQYYPSLLLFLPLGVRVSFFNMFPSLLLFSFTILFNFYCTEAIQSALNSPGVIAL